MEVDQRSDLYSLGIIFYEMLSGRLPLHADNPAGWVYAHMTQKPMLISEVNPDVPAVVSGIVMKLLSKDAEDRYQSAHGLQHDLMECKARFDNTGSIEHFQIGSFDISFRLRLPEKLYGREKEKRILEEAFSFACKGGVRTVLVSGYSGVGKTMLINKVLKPVAQEHGYFITGKFDQLEKNIPYAPFAEAFGNLIKQLMTESRERLDWWKRKILRAVERNASVITEIIPELEWIIGKQAPADPLPLKEAENRFLMAFIKFVKVFSRNGHPLVLFLDDLQWADNASVNLLKYLSQEGNLRSLLLVGAYRDNEVGANHPLTRILENKNGGQPSITHISLMPLNLDETAEFVADTLNINPEDALDLSEDLFRKSGGNPFFLRQHLVNIQDDGFLKFDLNSSCWKWEIEEIRKLQPGDDVLELILKKLERLPEETREVIKLAACIGNRFDLETLAVVYRNSQDETISKLMPAIREGLVLLPEPQRDHSVLEFLHDRVQQTVYSPIPEEEKREKHAAIGRLLLDKYADSGIEDKILSIMDHLNRSLELVHDYEERIKLAGYNLLAGQKAKSSAAYPSALKCFRAGKGLLTENSWKDAYRLSYDLYLELAQMEYITGNIDTAEQLFNVIIGKASNELERASVYSLKIILYAGVGKYSEAVHTGIDVLKNLGIKIPIHPNIFDYLKELVLYKWCTRGKQIEEFLNLPEIEDPTRRKIAELLNRLSNVTMTSHPDLHGLIILKAGNYTARYGNTEMACVGYLGYSIIAGNIFGNYAAGKKYARVSARLVEKYNRSSSKCIIYFVIGALISHWTSHAKYGLDYLEKSAAYGIEAGDILIAGYSYNVSLENRLFLGLPIKDVARQIKKIREVAKRLNHENLLIDSTTYANVVSALMGHGGNTLESGAVLFERDELVQMASKDKTSFATYHFYRMLLQYMIGNYRAVLSAAEEIKPLKAAINGFMISAEYNFYYSLAITAIYEELSFKERMRYKAVLRENQRQMKKWAGFCKSNFEHKYLLVAAETARLQKRKEEAMSLYERAIHYARENGYVKDEALANELAAKFYMSLGLKKIAGIYILEAYRAYNRWQAFAKAKDILSEHQELLEGIDEEKQYDDAGRLAESLLSVSTVGKSRTADGIDTYYLEKAVEKITMETDLDKLFHHFIDFAIKNVGADKGYLIIEKDGELYVEAAVDSSSCVSEIKTVALEQCNEIPKAVVRFVARTLETVNLDCRKNAGIFAADPYIAETNPSSIACIPLLLQGIPFGVLYLENSFIPGLFESNRLETLKLLSVQIAYANKLQSYLESDPDRTVEIKSFSLADELTEREKEVLKLIAKGLSNKEIADRLLMTVNTVKTHIKNIYGKLQVNRRIQAAEKAKEMKLL